MDVQNFNSFSLNASSTTSPFNDAFVNNPITRLIFPSSTLSTNSPLLQTLSINLLNNYDLQSEIFQNILSNIIITNQNTIFENVQQNVISNFLSDITNSALAFFALDNVSVNSNMNSQQLENINKLFYSNLNMPLQNWIRPAVSQKYKGQLRQSSAKPIAYTKKKLEKGKSIFKEKLAKFLNKILETCTI